MTSGGAGRDTSPLKEQVGLRGDLQERQQQDARVCPRMNLMQGARLAH
jgi:hypothetical protein